MTYGGLRFQDLLREVVEDTVDPGVWVENNCLLRAELGGHTLVFPAQMDCLTREVPLTRNSYQNLTCLFLFKDNIWNDSSSPAPESFLANCEK